jgi:hypothetical protein
MPCRNTHSSNVRTLGSRSPFVIPTNWIWHNLQGKLISEIKRRKSERSVRWRTHEFIYQPRAPSKCLRVLPLVNTLPSRISQRVRATFLIKTLAKCARRCKKAAAHLREHYLPSAVNSESASAVTDARGEKDTHALIRRLEIIFIALSEDYDSRASSSQSPNLDEFICQVCAPASLSSS